jgi:amino acid adenylation domain-containing protein
MTEPRPPNPTLAAKKRELLQRMLEARGLAGCHTPAIVHQLRRDDLPLSFAQQRMWFLQQLEPTSPAYNVTGAVTLRGLLDTTALERSFHEIARRHEILRTFYRLDARGTPHQTVSPDALPSLASSDLRGIPAAARDAAIDGCIAETALAVFDLERDAPLRLRHLQTGDDEHVLVMVLHHVACDDVTWGVLLTELTALYHAFQHGQPSPLPRLPLQYGDFAAWQRERVGAGALDVDLAYWRERLTPPPPVLGLYTDHPRPAAPSTTGARCSRTLPPAVAEGLQTLARHERGVTLYMVLLAAFKTLLCRYTGTTDLAVGSPAINRSQPGIEGLIGNFGNTLVLRTDLAGDPTFRELVQRVQATCTGAYAHQELPFERLVEELQPARAVNRSPLFDVMFSLRTDPLRSLDLAGLAIAERPAFNGSTRFDLALEASSNAGGLVLTLTYRTELFAAQTIDRMLGHLEVLITAIVRDPTLRIGALPVLTDAERQLLVHDWNQTAAPYDLGRPLNRLVEDQAASTPDRTAVTFEHQALTYRELDARANQLARHLVSLGVGPDSCVGVALERSLDLIVGLLAILKAGGAFVPLDPDLPAQRIELMCRDAGLAVVLSAHAAAPGITTVDPADARLAAYPVDRLPRSPAPEDIAYVIYTSGSTGVPKGVRVRHRGICNRVLWQASHLGLTPSDVVVHKTPMSFDVSVGEIFLALTTGARLVIARPGAHRDPAALLRLIARERVTFVNFVASLLDAFLDQPGLETEARSLAHVWCGGEALTEGLHARFRSRLQATLYHGYGPTEASVGVTCRVYRAEDGGARISIGRPIANTAIYLLDANAAPVPIGVPGELYIGGVSLARDYLNDPALTNRRFVPDRLGGEPGARLYRSGDLARYLPDGNIEFVGRVDNQVKLRGLRIELGEIEALLAQYPGVRQGVVLLRKDRPGAEHLAAYYVCDEHAAPSANDLRGWLHAKLPEYMVPRAFEQLASWPLTTSGKIDRQALPPIEVASSPAAQAVEPTDAMQRTIAQVWREVLGVEKVGAHDNFFDLGGHSLQLVKVQIRLQRELGRDIHLVDLFAHPTVAAAAHHLGGALRETHDGEHAKTRATRQRNALARLAATARRRPEP